MRVVHISVSPLSGSPSRIVRALNDHTEIEAKHIVLEPNHFGARTYPGGIPWKEDREHAVAEIEAADLVHIHNHFNLKENKFKFDFEALHKRGKPMLRHLHSSPEFFQTGDTRIVTDCPLPQLVVAQYQERHYLRARPVPNILPVENALYSPIEKEESPLRIFFAPTMPFSAWKVPPSVSRWATKGQLEVTRLLKRLEARMARCAVVIESVIIQNRPLLECMAVKQSCHLSIDDMVTGSFHISSLEALSHGIPVFNYIDSRTLATLRELTGADHIPWVNCRVEEAEIFFEKLIADADLRHELGKASRTWMLKYYHDRELVQHYVQAYRDVLEQPDVFKKNRLDPNEARVRWTVDGEYAAHYEGRVGRFERSAHRLCCAESAEYFESLLNLVRSACIVGFDKKPFLSWLFENRFKRIDPNVDFFHPDRARYLMAKYSFALPYIQGKHVLELGCGVGYGAAYLKEQGAASVTAVDNDMLAIAYAEENYARDGVSFAESDAQRIELPRASQDVVIAYDLLECVDCDGTLLERCRQLLKPGGVLLVSVCDLWHEKMENYWLRKYTAQSLLNLLHDKFSRIEMFRCFSSLSAFDEVSFSQPAIIPLNSFTCSLKRGESLLALCTLCE